MNNLKSLIVITWDGKSKPLDHVLIDSNRVFDLLIFDHSAQAPIEQVQHIQPEYYISTKTENKGQVLYEIYKYLYENDSAEKYEYIGFLDDDTYTSFSDLNKLIFIGKLNKLDVFQPSISHDSYFDHRQFTHKSGYQIINTNWVETMFPFYREKLFRAAGPYFNETITGQGMDVYMIPVLQVIHQMTNTAVVHAIQIKHCRPVMSGERTYSNGKSNFDNINHIRARSIELIEKNKELFDKDFVDKIIKVRYYNGISIFKKLKRVKGMLRNIYKELVDLSYR
jgi:hypothetical protein